MWSGKYYINMNIEDGNTSNGKSMREKSFVERDQKVESF
jgi:hypothetical protein